MSNNSNYELLKDDNLKFPLKHKKSNSCINNNVHINPNNLKYDNNNINENKDESNSIENESFFRYDKIQKETEKVTFYLFGYFILLFFISLSLAKYFLIYNDHKVGVNIVNFYRGLIYLLLSSLHITYFDKVNLEDPNNFNKDNFKQILVRSLFENGLYISILFSLKNLKLMTFASIFCVFILVKVISEKFYKERIFHKLDKIILTMSTISILLFFINTNEGYQRPGGLIFFLIFICFFILVKSIDKQIEANTNYFINTLSTSFISIAFSPLLISIVKEDTTLDIFCFILVILMSISAFYSQYLVYRLFKIWNEKNDSMTYYYSQILFICLIFFSLASNVLIFHEEDLNFYDVLGGFGVTSVFIAKYFIYLKN